MSNKSLMRATATMVSATILAGSLVLSAGALASETSPPVTILLVRPINNSSGTPGIAVVTVDQATICGTSAYKVQFSSANSKEVYAAVLAAHLTSRKVNIEVATCAGWGSDIKSVTVN